MSDFDTDLATGVAVLLDAASIGTWKPTGVYASGDTAIVLDELPQAPDAAIALAVYPITDDPALSDSVAGLQVMTRAGGQDPRVVRGIASSVFDQLHGLYGYALSTGIRVVNIERRGGASLGKDSLNRWGRVDNYYVTCWRPSTHRQ